MNTKITKYMSKENFIVQDGIITEAFPNTLFNVELENGHTILCHMSGKLKLNYIKLIPGDKVRVEISPYDLTKGRISYRYK